MSDIQAHKDQVFKNANTFKNLSGKEAMALRRENPVEYAQLRADAVEAGVIHGPNGYRKPGLHVFHYTETKPAITTEEIKARIRWPENEVRKYYQTRENANPAYDLSKLSREDHAAYESLRLAAQSYNVIERSEPRPQHQPVDAPQGSTNPIVLGEHLGKLAGLPATTEITSDQLFELNEHANALVVEKAK